MAIWTRVSDIYSSKDSKAGRWVFAAATVMCLAIMSFLARSVIVDLNELRSAKTDTVQWTLSQVEIEYLNFRLSIHEAQENAPPDLERLRKDFDVFFSRHDIIAQGLVFKDARQVEAFAASAEAIAAFLNETAPLIDGDDATLLAALPQISAEVEALGPAVRGLYVSGLGHFTIQSDRLRERLSATLWQLTWVTMVLIATLAVLAVYSRATATKSRMRGRELARANAHMETILSTSLDGVIVSDHTGRVVDFNAAAEAIFGYKLEDIRGQLIGDLIVPPELRAAHQAGMDRMIRTGEKKLVGHGRIRIEAARADGTIFPVELALQSATGADGEILIAFLRDISAQVEAEEELRQARDQALAGEKAKAEFLTVMSHEIRTPLSGLLGNLSLLSDTQLDAEQAQFTGNMSISGRQLLKHVNSILDIARFESGKLPIEERAFHLGAFLQEIVDSQSGPAENRQTAIGWSWIGPSLDWVHGDEGLLEQILLNLVGNAIKFTENGRIDIELEQTGHKDGAPLIEMRVIDTGIGIAEADQERIFEDFETGARHGGQIGSTGLGLGISKRLASLMRGEIGVESTVGEGSVFWLRLPMPKGHKPAAASGEDADAALVDCLQILLVEDNEMNAFVVEKMLQAEGHQVTWAQDGLEAIEWAEKATFDVILMDINMPRLGGLEATQRIRAEIDHAKDTPIFAFSANVLPEDTKRFRESGMDGFIGKPVQIEEMRAALASVGRGPAVADTPVAETQDARAMFGENYDQFLTRFLDEADELVAWVQTAEDREEIVQRCHKISATAALFGAQAFHAALQRLEQEAKPEGIADLTAPKEQVAQAWATAREGLVANA
ncbi:MAG: ATP-binding protein [Cognatishimia sp.]